MNEERLRDALRRAPLTDAEGAEERGLRLALAAARERSGESEGRRRRPGGWTLRVALALALIAAIASPAGAAVRDWVRDAVEDQSPPPLPALTSLPSEGRLLVDSPQGPWVVDRDGSKRLLGPYREATWSPHGLYVAAASGHQLAAIEPGGTVHWTLSRPAPVSDPAWSPDGSRIAYRSGEQLRIVVGNGTGDAPLAASVAAVAPAREPGAARVLAYLGADGVVRVIRAGGGGEIFSAEPAARPKQIAWSADGSRLLLVSPRGVEALDSRGSVAWRVPAPRGWRIADAVPAPDGEGAAVALESRSGERGSLRLLGPDGGRDLFDGPGRFSEVVASPDGRWLLLGWEGADQWLFLNPSRPRRVVAVADIAAQFDPGASSPSAFPGVAGWCCASDAG
jgi:hypothetical protein